MNKPGKSSFFKASLLASLLASTFTVQAAGLGKLTVYSAIGQPLNAEVALTAADDELASLSAKLAAHDAFKEAGVEFMPALAGLRFNVVKLPNNQVVLQLTTDRPLNEPFLHFLLELNWTAGRMVREYTFLLDPPEMLQTAQPAAVVAPAVTPVATVAAPQRLPEQTQPALAPAPVAPAPVAAAERTPAVAAKTPVARPVSAVKPAPAGELLVKSGDTLSQLALDNKSEGVSLDQMLVAMLNSNRDAFDGNNMNRLRAGKILRLPDAAAVAQVDVAEARKLIVSQAADFNVYRRRLAAAAQTMPVADAASAQQATGKIKPHVEEKTPPPPAKDKLDVSRAEVAKSSKAGADGKGSLEEDLIARDKALREAASRIAGLEKNLENLKQLVELKSQAGAQLQQQAQAEVAKPAAPAVSVAPPAAPAPVTEKPQEPAAVQPELAKPIEPIATPVPAAPSVPPSAPKPAINKPLAPPPPPPPEPSFVEDNLGLVLGGGSLIALLLGYFGYTAWRKKKQALEDESTFVNEPSIAASDLPVISAAPISAPAESLDSGEISIQGDFSEGGMLTTEESVDPVAEADVYMAYGRDSQAEEILLEGLKTDPTRSAIHLKLLELYANRKSIEPFEGVAQKLHGLTAGQGHEWAMAARMAATLGISGGLFAESGSRMAADDRLADELAPEDEVSALSEVSAVTDAAAAAGIMPAAEPPQEVAPAVDEGTGSLDFDLDLGTTSGPVAAVEPAAEQPAADEAMSLDFDFDLGMPEPAAVLDVTKASAVMAESAGSMSPDATRDVAELDGNVIDFSLDIDRPADVVEAIAAPADDGNMMDFDLDLGSTTDSEMAPVPAATDVGTARADEFDIDFPIDISVDKEPESAPAGGMSDLKLDFDLELDAEPVADEAAALDLSDIGFDLGEPAEDASPTQDVSLDELALPEISEVMRPADAAVELPDIDLPADFPAPAPIADAVESLAPLPDLDFDVEAAPVMEQPAAPAAPAAPDGHVADDPEVATKLELAQAYEEMGDREGARELLNEVLAEGSPRQQALARTRLEQLNG